MTDLIWLALALGLTVLGIIYIWLLGAIESHDDA
jgi:hypothetical protein